MASYESRPANAVQYHGDGQHIATQIGYANSITFGRVEQAGL
ncbi:hypothetical protein [Paenibacillus farraposensis]|nr:hypothetical protein [Paenibacillus farraposensis]